MGNHVIVLYDQNPLTAAKSRTTASPGTGETFDGLSGVNEHVETGERE